MDVPRRHPPGPTEFELRSHKREQLNISSLSTLLPGFVAPPLPPGWLDQLWSAAGSPGFTSGPNLPNTSFAATIGSGRFMILRIPHRMVMAAAMLGVFVCWLRGFLLLRRLRREMTESCPRCTYNLAGNISGVCPECGTPIKNRVGIGE